MIAAFVLACLAPMQVDAPPATIPELDFDAMIATFDEPARRAELLATLVDRERFGVLPAPSSGPCTVDYRESTWDGHAWCVDVTRVRARYDDRCRLVEHERWDHARILEYRRTIAYADDGGWTETFHLPEGTVRDIVTFEPLADGSARMVQRVTRSGVERTWLLDDERRTRELRVTVDAWAFRLVTDPDEEPRPRDVLAMDHGALRPVSRSSLEWIDGWWTRTVRLGTPGAEGATSLEDAGGRDATDAARSRPVRVHGEIAHGSGLVQRIRADFAPESFPRRLEGIGSYVLDARGRLVSWCAHDERGPTLRTYAYVDGPDGAWSERVESRLELDGEPRLVRDHRLRRVVTRTLPLPR